MRWPLLLLLHGSIAVLSCGESQVDSSRSLVGAEKLPTEAALANEVIQINSGYGDVSTGFLSYELRPDDSLKVTHTNRREDRIVGEETFQLSPSVARHARRMLWRLRPADLAGKEQGLDHEIRPFGCERTGPHDFGELAIVFVDEAQTPVIDDDRVALFELPSPASCSRPEASKARELMGTVLQSFPRSDVAAQFARRDEDPAPATD